MVFTLSKIQSNFVPKSTRFNDIFNFKLCCQALRLLSSVQFLLCAYILLLSAQILLSSVQFLLCVQILLLSAQFLLLCSDFVVEHSDFVECLDFVVYLDFVDCSDFVVECLDFVVECSDFVVKCLFYIVFIHCKKLLICANFCPLTLFIFSQ